MPIGYVIKRIAIFFVILWAAATFNFFLPRLTGINPVEQRMTQMASQGGAEAGDISQMIKFYEEKFGLNEPLLEQYGKAMWNTAQLDFGFSIMFFPSEVTDVIIQALPWTMGLLVMAILITFFVGIFIGAIVAWPGAPRTVKALLPPLMGLSAIPHYLIGIVLIFGFAFTLEIFPLSGGYSLGLEPSFDLGFIANAAKHSVLPAAALVLTGLGLQALSMRGMMITTLGEDYMLEGEAKGLTRWRLFVWYGIRNAMLPQVTHLALSLGHVVSGAILVEVVFGYPGVGGILLQAIQTFDYTLIFGIVFMVILSIALATLLLDLLYPRLDPRIKYGQA